MSRFTNFHGFFYTSCSPVIFTNPSSMNIKTQNGTFFKYSTVSAER